MIKCRLREERNVFTTSEQQVQTSQLWLSESWECEEHEVESEWRGQCEIK